MGRLDHLKGLKLLTTKEVAEITGYSPKYIAILARQGKIKAIKPTGRLLISESAVVEFLKRGEQ